MLVILIPLRACSLSKFDIVFSRLRSSFSSIDILLHYKGSLTGNLRELQFWNDYFLIIFSAKLFNWIIIAFDICFFYINRHFGFNINHRKGLILIRMLT